MKLTKITGEERRLLTSEFYRTRKILSPLLDHFRMSDIDVRWWHKRRETHTAGMCHKGLWRIRLDNKRGYRLVYVRNLILLDKDYHDLMGQEELVLTFRHELLHLIAKDTHGTHFKRLARVCGAKRYCTPRPK